MMSSGTVARSARQILARAVDAGVGDLLEEDVRLAVDDAVALLDGGAPDGLREMALAGAGRSEEERVLVLGDEARGRELVDEARFIFLLKSKSKLSRVRSASRKAACLRRRSKSRSVAARARR